MRDLAGVLGTGLPIWRGGAAPPTSDAGLNPVDWQGPTGCGGVAVFPSDAVVVVDGDGAAPVPQALLDAAVETAAEQEALEPWIVGEVEKDAALPGLYPSNGENEARRGKR